MSTTSGRTIGIPHGMRRLLEEMAQQVLSKHPTNIPIFLADYLAGQVALRQDAFVRSGATCGIENFDNYGKPPRRSKNYAQDRDDFCMAFQGGMQRRPQEIQAGNEIPLEGKQSAIGQWYADDFCKDEMEKKMEQAGDQGLDKDQICNDGVPAPGSTQQLIGPGQGLAKLNYAGRQGASGPHGPYENLAETNVIVKLGTVPQQVDALTQQAAFVVDMTKGMRSGEDASRRENNQCQNQSTDFDRSKSSPAVAGQEQGQRILASQQPSCKNMSVNDSVQVLENALGLVGVLEDLECVKTRSEVPPSQSQYYSRAPEQARSCQPQPAYANQNLAPNSQVNPNPSGQGFTPVYVNQAQASNSQTIRCPLEQERAPLCANQSQARNSQVNPNLLGGQGMVPVYAANQTQASVSQANPCPPEQGRMPVYPNQGLAPNSQVNPNQSGQGIAPAGASQAQGYNSQTNRCPPQQERMPLSGNQTQAPYYQVNTYPSGGQGMIPVYCNQAQASNSETIRCPPEQGRIPVYANQNQALNSQTIHCPPAQGGVPVNVNQNQASNFQTAPRPPECQNSQRYNPATIRPSSAQIEHMAHALCADLTGLCEHRRQSPGFADTIRGAIENLVRQLVVLMACDCPAAQSANQTGQNTQSVVCEESREGPRLASGMSTARHNAVNSDPSGAYDPRQMGQTNFQPGSGAPSTGLNSQNNFCEGSRSTSVMSTARYNAVNSDPSGARQVGLPGSSAVVTGQNSQMNLCDEVRQGPRLASGMSTARYNGVNSAPSGTNDPCGQVYQSLQPQQSVVLSGVNSQSNNCDELRQGPRLASGMSTARYNAVNPDPSSANQAGQPNFQPGPAVPTNGLNSQNNFCEESRSAPVRSTAGFNALNYQPELSDASAVPNSQGNICDEQRQGPRLASGMSTARYNAVNPDPSVASQVGQPNFQPESSAAASGLNSQSKICDEIRQGPRLASGMSTARYNGVNSTETGAKDSCEAWNQSSQPQQNVALAAENSRRDICEETRQGPRLASGMSTARYNEVNFPPPGIKDPSQAGYPNFAPGSNVALVGSSVDEINRCGNQAKNLPPNSTRGPPPPIPPRNLMRPVANANGIPLKGLAAWMFRNNIEQCDQMNLGQYVEGMVQRASQLIDWSKQSFDNNLAARGNSYPVDCMQKATATSKDLLHTTTQLLEVIENTEPVDPRTGQPDPCIPELIQVTEKMLMALRIQIGRGEQNGEDPLALEALRMSAEALEVSLYLLRDYKPKTGPECDKLMNRTAPPYAYPPINSALGPGNPGTAGVANSKQCMPNEQPRMQMAPSAENSQQFPPASQPNFQPGSSAAASGLNSQSNICDEIRQGPRLASGMSTARYNGVNSTQTGAIEAQSNQSCKENESLAQVRPDPAPSTASVRNCPSNVAPVEGSGAQQFPSASQSQSQVGQGSLAQTPPGPVPSAASVRSCQNETAPVKGSGAQLFPSASQSQSQVGQERYDGQGSMAQIRPGPVPSSASVNSYPADMAPSVQPSQSQVGPTVNQSQVNAGQEQYKQNQSEPVPQVRAEALQSQAPTRGQYEESAGMGQSQGQSGQGRGVEGPSGDVSMFGPNTGPHFSLGEHFDDWVEAVRDFMSNQIHIIRQLLTGEMPLADAQGEIIFLSVSFIVGIVAGYAVARSLGLFQSGATFCGGGPPAAAARCSRFCASSFLPIPFMDEADIQQILVDLGLYSPE